MDSPSHFYPRRAGEILTRFPRLHLGRGGATIARVPRPDPAARPAAGWSEGQIAAAFGNLVSLVQVQRDDLAQRAPVHRGDLLDLLDSPEVFDAVCRRFPSLIRVVGFPVDPREPDLWPFRLRLHAYFAPDAGEAWAHIGQVYAELGARLQALTRTVPVSAPLLQTVLPGGGESPISAWGDTVVAVQRRRPAGQVHVLRPSPGEHIALALHGARERSVSAACLSPDGDQLVLRRGAGYQGWNILTGERRWHTRLAGERGWPVPEAGSTRAVGERDWTALDAGFTRLACRVRDGLAMLDPRDGRVLWRARKGTRIARRVVKIEGRSLTVGESGAVYLPPGSPSEWWDDHLFSDTRPGLSPDGTEVCMTSNLALRPGVGVVVMWWDASDGHLLHLDTTRAVTQAGMPPPSPIYAPDGSTMLTISGALDSAHLPGEEVSVWNARTHRPVAVLVHDAVVREAVYAPDGRTIATVAGSNVVSLWETATGGLLHRWNVPDWIYHIGVSADGGGVVIQRFDGPVRVLSSAGAVGPPLGYPRRGELLLAAGGTVFATLEGRAVVVRDARSGEPVAALDHLAWVEDMWLSADGRTAVTYSTDRVTRVWRVPGI